VIEHGVSGFLIDQNAGGLVPQIAAVLAMPAEKLAAIGERARTATRRFSWMQIAPRYEQLYREVLSSRARMGARPS
jgi:glycosyltransferase involved in cell wall biosynthesis